MGDRGVAPGGLLVSLARLCAQATQPVCWLICRKSVGFVGRCPLALLPEKMLPGISNFSCPGDALSQALTTAGPGRQRKSKTRDAIIRNAERYRFHNQSTCFSEALGTLQCFWFQEFLRCDMTDSTGWIIHLVIGDQDLLPGMIQTAESTEFPLISLLP